MEDHYEITEQDIEGMLRYLKYFHPENANRDYAQEMLEYLRAGYQRLALTDPKALDDLYDAFEKSKARPEQ